MGRSGEELRCPYQLTWPIPCSSTVFRLFPTARSAARRRSECVRPGLANYGFAELLTSDDAADAQTDFSCIRVSRTSANRVFGIKSVMGTLRMIEKTVHRTKSLERPAPRPFNEPVYVSRPLVPPLEAYIEHLRAIWTSKQLTNAGAFTCALERGLSAYLRAPHVSLVNNGTAALMIACKALNLRERSSQRHSRSQRHRTHSVGIGSHLFLPTSTQ